MYYLKWNYEENFLPTCFVWYEQELYENEKEVEEERQTVQGLQELCEVFNGVTKDINKNGFPDLCPPNYKNSQGTYPFYYYAKTKELGIIDVPCDKIAGDNWANLPKEMRDHYPKPRKFRDLLVGYLNLNEELKHTKESIPPIKVSKVMDDYFCDEGNHRLYVSRLLGFETIKAEVVEYDYLTLLKESYEYTSSPLEYYLALPDGENDHVHLYEATEEDMVRYYELKKQYRLKHKQKG
jgi:hypothetical protein